MTAGADDGNSARSRVRLAVLLAVIPAAPLLGLGFTEEYWGRIYHLWGATFAAVNCLLLHLLLSRRGRTPGPVPTTMRIFVRQLIAWCLSFPALAAINLTPLCLGQNNGDGHNDMVLCLLLTVIWPVYMSGFVVPLAYLVSAGVRRIVLTGLQQPGGATQAVDTEAASRWKS